LKYERVQLLANLISSPSCQPISTDLSATL